MRRKAPHRRTTSDDGGLVHRSTNAATWPVGNRVIAERHAARGYYESGAVRYEHRTEREVVWLDPRLGSGQATQQDGWLERVIVRLMQWTIAAAAIGMGAIAGWAGWTLGRLTGAVVMILILAVLYAHWMGD